MISGVTKSLVTEVCLVDLLQCRPLHVHENNGTTLHYIELISRAESSNSMSYAGPEHLRRPKVRCDSGDGANWVKFNFELIFKLIHFWSAYRNEK